MEEKNIGNQTTNYVSPRGCGPKLIIIDKPRDGKPVNWEMIENLKNGMALSRVSCRRARFLCLRPASVLCPASVPSSLVFPPFRNSRFPVAHTHPLISHSSIARASLCCSRPARQVVNVKWKVPDVDWESPQIVIFANDDPADFVGTKMSADKIVDVELRAFNASLEGGIIAAPKTLAELRAHPSVKSHD